MSQPRRYGSFLAALAILAFLMVGCSDDSTDPVPPVSQEADLDDAFGGWTAQDEEPAFGDVELASSISAEVPYEDPLSEDEEIQRWQQTHQDSIHTYVVTLLWGMLSEDPSQTTRPDDESEVPVTDWSGHLFVNHGGLGDSGRTDHVVDRRRVGWISHTTGGYDGLRILIFQPFLDGESGEEDSLTVLAGDHRWDFLISDLAELDYEDAVGESGNKFALRSILVEPTVCAHGFLGGAWTVPAHRDSLGHFRGRWISRDGSVAGFLRGYCGFDSHGKKVFFGKYVALDGAFLGFLRGTWDEVGIDTVPGHSSRDRHHGWFRGDWVDGDELLMGRLRGSWRSIPGEDGGFFEGGWTGVCLGRP